MPDNGKTIYVGSDQKAYKLKNEIAEFLKSKGWNCVELGVFKDDETPYDRIKTEVEDRVNIEEPGSTGILVFGTQEKKEEEEQAGS